MSKEYLSNDENNFENNDTSKLNHIRKSKVDDFKLDLNLEEEVVQVNDSNNIKSHSIEFDAIKEMNSEQDISSFSNGKMQEIKRFEDNNVPPVKQKTFAAPRPRMVRGKKRNGCLYSMIYSVVIVLVSLLLSKFIVAGAYDFLGVNKEEGTAVIKIEPGFENQDVYDQLIDTGVVKEPFFFITYAKLTDAKFSVGEYQISKTLDYEGIFSGLQQSSNRLDVVTLTFPEGFTIFQIAERLDAAKVCDYDEFIEEITNGDFSNYSFIRDMIPDEVTDVTSSSSASSVASNSSNVASATSSEATSSEEIKEPNPGAAKYDDKVFLLEGYMFPDTYNFYKYSSPRSVIIKFLNNFNNRITAEMYDKADKLGMTMDEVITLASIVEKEVAITNDRYKVASVFINRLNSPTYPMLQSDTTNYYPFVMGEVPEGYVSKYDTYKVEGLPPGAICSPSLVAINSVLNHAKTNYYYFVTDVNSKAYYSTTLAGHEKNIAIANSVKKQQESAKE